MLGSQMERPLRLVVVAAGVMLVAAPALGQGAKTLAADLRKDVPCSSGAMSALEAAITRSEAPTADIAAALDTVAADPDACQPLHDAAIGLAISRAGPAVGDDTSDDRIAAASRSIVAQTLAEAERRAANLKFEVGPPPPNLTKGRNPGL